MVGIGLIGYGHWGPNHVRVFNQLPGSRVVIVADGSGERLEAVRQQVAGTKTEPACKRQAAPSPVGRPR